MTRAELTDILINEAAPAMVERESLNDATRECLALALQAAAAELRKTCGTCRYWTGQCNEQDGPIHIPADGSGFCHRWEGKP